MASAHTVRWVVREVVAEAGIREVADWEATLAEAAQLLPVIATLALLPEPTTPAIRVAAAALAQARVLGISVEEAARCVSDDCRFDVLDPRVRFAPRRRAWSRDDDEAAFEDQVADAARKGE